jgi:hypothetical protein
MVAVLYCDPRGAYWDIPDVDPWPIERDARGYTGPYPVIAHPPCGSWSSNRHLSHAGENERALAPLAVEQVRRWGGVLEHPAGSQLWAHCGLPRPDELPDQFGGYTVEINQCDWGHCCRKRTWIYLVGVPRAALVQRESREPTHWASGRARKSRSGGAAVPPGIKVASAEQRRRTPPEFARYLVTLASAAVKP